MALQNFQYDIIMREYNRRQSQVQHDLEERRAEAFARVPRLLEIDGEVAALSAQKARSLLQGEPGSVDDLKKDVSALSAERRSLLKKNGFSELFLLGLLLVCFLSLLFFLLLHLCKSLYHGSFQQVGSDLAAADTK